MASPAAGVTTGLAITFASGFFAQITDFSHSGVKRKAQSTAHMGLAAAGAGTYGNEPFIPGKIIDPGGLDIEGHYNPDTLPPIGSAAETVTVSVPGSTVPATLAGSAFMTDFDVKGPLDEVMKFTAKLKFSGAITRTAGT